MRYSIRTNINRRQSSYNIPTNDMSFLSNSAAALQQRGQILAFLFGLSLVTTLWTVVHFHNRSNPDSVNRIGMIRFDYAAEVFIVNRHGGGGNGIGSGREDNAAKEQMLNFLSHRYSGETRKLKWNLSEGLLGKVGNNKTMKREESIEEDDDNRSKDSEKSSLAKQEQNNALPDFFQQMLPKPSYFSLSEPRGFFVEYYACGGNPLLSVTLPMEKKYMWRGVLVFPDKTKVLEDKVRNQRSPETYIGTGFRLCHQDKGRLGNESTTNGQKLPNPLPVPAPYTSDEIKVHNYNQQTSGSGISNAKGKTNEELDEKSNLAIDVKSSPTESLLKYNELDKSSIKPSCKLDQEVPCYNLFSLLYFFQTYKVHFFSIHSNQTAPEIIAFVRTILGLRPLVEIKAISITQPVHSSLHKKGLKDLENFMEKSGYIFEAVILYNSGILSGVMAGTTEYDINGSRSMPSTEKHKHANMINDVFKKSQKQYLFIMKSINKAPGFKNLDQYLMK